MKFAVVTLISIFSICALVEGATGQFFQQASIAISGSVILSGDGNTAIVGASVPMVFTRSNGAWMFQGSLAIPGFNWSNAGSVALSADGGTLVVGSRAANAGGAFVFVRNNGVWTQQGVLQEGGAIAISSDGNTIALGAPTFLNDPGVWVYTRNNGVWSQQGGKLAIPGSSLYFGMTLALSGDGNTLLVPDGVGYVFTRANGVWTQQSQTLTPSDPAGQPGIASVALSADGNTAISRRPR